ncbi:sphingosine-1-phosphate lyase 1-like [Liolophura sinensis]|uniref:sphingosine-1-phosphate lyase 1-like n=1 Tax=Liolophura sinensis TaxID=3198878 RepID=UPI003158A51E
MWEHLLSRLPEQGLSEEDLFKLMDKYRTMNTVDWASGSCSGTVYSGEPELTQLAAKTYGLYAWANPLHPDVFPDVRRMEAEIVRMCCTMFNGGPETCGVMTSGGTESILLACLCYRNLAYERGIKHPEMLCPVTAHAAFDKAAAFFRIKMVHVPVDPETQVVDVRAMRRLISRRTCMMVASVPQFPHGTVDPVEDVAALGKRYGVPVHVDACLGGFLIPFMEKAGFNLPPFDFRLEGVTSISADSHKYGFAPKGSSVILYRNPDLRKQQCFSQPDWPGGIYATPTIAGSRAGAIIATCWATMMHIGENGYVESTKKIIATTKFIDEGLRKIHGIHVVGEPKVCVVAIASKHFNVYRLSDAIRVKGWSLNPLQFPSSIHLCVTYVHTKPGVAQRFLDDVRSSVAEIMNDPQAECGGAAAIYGMAQSIPDRTLVNDMAQIFIDACYSTSQPVSNGEVHSQTNATMHSSE